MRVVRRPPIYDAVRRSDGEWVVTNVRTKEARTFTDKEFKEEFQPISMAAPAPPKVPQPPPKPAKPTVGFNEATGEYFLIPAEKA